MAFNATTQECDCLNSFVMGKDGICTCKAGEILMGTTCQPCEKAKWKSKEVRLFCTQRSKRCMYLVHRSNTWAFYSLLS